MEFVRTALFGATFLTALGGATGAVAEDAHGVPDPVPQIFVPNNVDPNEPLPDGGLSKGVNGVGLFGTDASDLYGPGSFFVCTATLINPRTVLLAAHCVNFRDPSSFGAATGGAPAMVDFSDDGTDGFSQYFGFDGPPDHATDVSKNVYNLNQVWYDPRSVDANGNLTLLADVALATLDTPATRIPSWAMLFTPLDGPTHATITGYGLSGRQSDTDEQIQFDFRRHAAENLVSMLGSRNDLFNTVYQRTRVTSTPGELYQIDFNSPDYLPEPYDFDVFLDAPLEHEGAVGEGDSGGPLIVDQRYGTPVIAGVLSAYQPFFSGQPGNKYGAVDLYQPLFQYWNQIVANNPYVYAGAKPGDGAWENPNHWVQLMDPAYQIDVNGSLVNALPNFMPDPSAILGPRFGTLSTVTGPDDIADLSAPLATSARPIVIPGGPGSTHFVPKNQDPDPHGHKLGRYYDVTLSQPGNTTLGSNVTIDKLTMNGTQARLTIAPTGNLTVLTDYTQAAGWTQVDGRLASGDMLIANGVLAGGGTIDPTFLTVANAGIVPGNAGTIGTLTIKGDLILTSATSVFTDFSKSRADRITVLADGGNSGIAGLAGTLVATLGNGAIPRFGQTFIILTADGGIQGQFGSVASMLPGVLKVDLSYGANAVTAQIGAGSLAANLAGHDPIATSFANALDKLRGQSYNQLSNLYGEIDVMDARSLTGILDTLSPRIVGEALSMNRQQNGELLGMVSDRLSLLGTDAVRRGTFSVVGAPASLGSFGGRSGTFAPWGLTQSLIGTRTTASRLPDSMSGFISQGNDAGALSLTDSRGMVMRTSWHMAMGLEWAAAPSVTLGTAFGIAGGHAALTGSDAQTTTSQWVGYGSYRLGGGAYIAGLASAGFGSFDLSRGDATRINSTPLNGAAKALSYDMELEVGKNLTPVTGLTVSPRASLRYSAVRIGGYREAGNETALLVDAVKDHRLEARIGVTVDGEVQVGGGWFFKPQLSADNVRALDGGSRMVTVRFADAAGVPVALPLISNDRKWTEARAAIRLAKGSLAIDAGVKSDIGRAEYRNDRATIGFTKVF
jgi:hypothetical protein